MLRVTARAKINWTLDILGTRPDGYHRMDMLLSSVAWHDTLWVTQAEGLALEVAELGAGGQNAEAPLHSLQPRSHWMDAQATAVPLDEKNLVMKAALALRHATGCEKGAHMRLEKRIPTGAGMGGGSADAAAALLGLCQLWGLRLPQEQLLALGLSIGADVPFLLTGGLCRVGGIGEVLTPLPCRHPFWLVVVQPCQGLSTPEIFRAFDSLPSRQVVRPQTDQAQQALQQGDARQLALAMGNVMEPVSLQKRPDMGQALEALARQGALRAMMTGSGSAVYGLFETEEKARAAYEKLRGQWERMFVTHTTKESVTWEEVQ